MGLSFEAGLKLWGLCLKSSIFFLTVEAAEPGVLDLNLLGFAPHATIQRDGSTHVFASDYHSSFIYPRLSDRGLEGDMGDEGSHLLAPDCPLPAAYR